MTAGGGWMRRWARDVRGMSLMELVIVLLVMSIVSGAVVSLLLVSLKTYWKGDISTQVQQGGRVGLDRLSRDLRQGRRLYSGTPGGYQFSIGCTQLSFVLPHLGNVTLKDPVSGTTTTIYGTDPNASGTLPYDGSYVTYYLSATAGATPTSTNINTAGPYLIRASYDITTSTLTTLTLANNITALAFASAGTCPTATSQEVNITLTASQQSASQNVSSTDVVTQDICIRNTLNSPCP